MTKKFSELYEAFLSEENSKIVKLSELEAQGFKPLAGFKNLESSLNDKKLIWKKEHGQPYSFIFMRNDNYYKAYIGSNVELKKLANKNETSSRSNIGFLDVLEKNKITENDFFKKPFEEQVNMIQQTHGSKFTFEDYYVGKAFDIDFNN